MPDITETERKILTVLDERGGAKTGLVAKRVPRSALNTNDPRRHTTTVRWFLLGLFGRGLVAHLDDQKPVCWVRTAAGTAAIEREAANV